ncbi:MAG: hypothetical protein AAFR38_03235 [Planctomycetota bacterium]
MTRLLASLAMALFVAGTARGQERRAWQNVLVERLTAAPWAARVSLDGVSHVVRADLRETDADAVLLELGEIRVHARAGRLVAWHRLDRTRMYEAIDVDLPIAAMIERELPPLVSPPLAIALAGHARGSYLVTYPADDRVVLGARERTEEDGEIAVGDGDALALRVGWPSRGETMPDAFEREIDGVVERFDVGWLDPGDPESWLAPLPSAERVVAIRSLAAPPRAVRVGDLIPALALIDPATRERWNVADAFRADSDGPIGVRDRLKLVALLLVRADAGMAPLGVAADAIESARGRVSAGLSVAGVDPAVWPKVLGRSVAVGAGSGAAPLRPLVATDRTIAAAERATPASLASADVVVIDRLVRGSSAVLLVIDERLSVRAVADLDVAADVRALTDTLTELLLSR